MYSFKGRLGKCKIAFVPYTVPDAPAARANSNQTLSARPKSPALPGRTK